MLIKPFAILFKDQVEPTAMSYLGFVEDNNDPEKLGRIKVRISLYSELKTEELPWATPRLSYCGNSAEYGGLNIPELGSQVRIDFPSHDITAPSYSGAELNSLNRTTFFDEDYPNTYGFKDSIGNFIKVNKERGTVHLQHNSTTNMQVAYDGSIKVGLSNGAFFIFDNDKNFDLNIGTLDITGTADGSLKVEANNEIELKAGKTTVKGNLVVEGDLMLDEKAGASGSFMALGSLVTVKNGLVVSIQP